MQRPAATAPRYRPRRFGLRDGREVTLRAITEDDKAEIVQAFDRLSADSRYLRFMRHKKQIDPAALEQGVRPRPGEAFVLVATVPAADGIDIVGAAQYLHAARSAGRTCEFAVTVAEDWRGGGLAARLLQGLLRSARRDSFETMEGWVLAENLPMLTLARRLHFRVEAVADDTTLFRVARTLQPAAAAPPTTAVAPA
jgi:RimJ/RimL family protein N-acetyltransferase